MNNTDNYYTYLHKKLKGLDRVLKAKKPTADQQACMRFLYETYQKGMTTSDKKKLRKIYKKKRAAIPAGEHAERSATLCEKIIALPEFRQAQTIFCYIAFNHEIETHSLITHSLKAGKRVCVPVIDGRQMIAAHITGLDAMQKNTYGILEPTRIIPIPGDEIDIIIVPALAFNALGYRLGYGGGFYDRFLDDYTGITIGPVLKELLIHDLIPDSHDLPVTHLLIG